MHSSKKRRKLTAAECEELEARNKLKALSRTVAVFTFGFGSNGSEAD